MTEYGNGSDSPSLPLSPIPTVTDFDAPAATQDDFAAPPVLPTVQHLAASIQTEIHKALVGQTELVEQLIIAVLAGGHVLLEGVPGTAKTLSIRALARIFDVAFTRVQFTPDLMPSDILGTNVFDPRDQEFHLRRGPIFTSMLLADEINRTPPKTQSALLEAMEERRVTIDGVGYPLADPFLVCATQNPIEFEGTYPLPEAQLDRFMLKIIVDYPSEADESALLARVQQGFRAQDLAGVGIEPVLQSQELAVFRAEVDKVQVDPSIQKYILQIVRSTRSHRDVTLGASPRAAITLILTTKARAAIYGRNYVTPDDVKSMARPALRHRIVIRPEAEMEGITGDRIVDSVLLSTEVPR